MARLHLLRGGRPDDDRPDHAGDDRPAPNDPITRALRAEYSAPPEGYWDSLESRVMAAVRAGRGAPTAVAEWWQALAAWTRPGLAAASVVLAVAGAAFQARIVRDAATVSESALEPMDAELARALDLLDVDAVTPEQLTEAREARDAADLLIDGVYRRPLLPLPPHAPSTAPSDAPSTPPSRARDLRDADGGQVNRARREATFRYLMP